MVQPAPIKKVVHVLAREITDMFLSVTLVREIIRSDEQALRAIQHVLQAHYFDIDWRNQAREQGLPYRISYNLSGWSIYSTRKISTDETISSYSFKPVQGSLSPSSPVLVYAWESDSDPTTDPTTKTRESQKGLSFIPNFLKSLQFGIMDDDRRDDNNLEEDEEEEEESGHHHTPELPPSADINHNNKKQKRSLKRKKPTAQTPRKRSTVTQSTQATQPTSPLLFSSSPNNKVVIRGSDRISGGHGLLVTGLNFKTLGFLINEANTLEEVNCKMLKVKGKIRIIATRTIQPNTEIIPQLRKGEKKLQSSTDPAVTWEVVMPCRFSSKQEKSMVCCKRLDQTEFNLDNFSLMSKMYPSETKCLSEFQVMCKDIQVTPLPSVSDTKSTTKKPSGKPPPPPPQSPPPSSTSTTTAVSAVISALQVTVCARSLRDTKNNDVNNNDANAISSLDEKISSHKKNSTPPPKTTTTETADDDDNKEKVDTSGENMLKTKKELHNNLIKKDVFREIENVFFSLPGDDQTTLQTHERQRRKNKKTKRQSSASSSSGHLHHKRRRRTKTMQIVCHKCKKSGDNLATALKQTRSADEGMTVKMFCQNCDIGWTLWMSKKHAHTAIMDSMCPAAVVTFMSEPFGHIATVLKIASFVPQIVKMRKTNDASSSSLGMHLLITATIICWILHVLVRKKERIDYPVPFANLVSLMPVGCIVHEIVTAPKADRENKNDAMKKETKDDNVCKT
eukprot:jgi/Bigna1/76090/fgenesh1_pg.39_\